MASSPAYPPSPAFALSLRWRGTPRILRFNTLAGSALAAALALLAVWSLGATGYLVFHDQLMAALLSRQADMQYSYEDRIATLRNQLDRQTSRALVDRQTLTTTMQDLASRSAQLEARAGTIETLVRGLGSADAPVTSMARGTAKTQNPLLSQPFPQLPVGVSAYAAPTAPAPADTSPALRLDRDADSDAGGDRAALSTDQEGQRLAAVLAQVEARQAAAVAQLRAPTMQAIARFERALADTGLPASRWRLSGIGGPFVPLPDGVRSGGVDADVALLRDAMEEHVRLARLADGVPLRRPIQGSLEVTSPFGARLDPFYGRAAMHTGMDLMGGYGGPVFATASGTVTVAGSEGGYGNMVEIDHGNGLTTRYAHLGSIDVVLHQKVSTGTILGRVGATGRATGPHLHYETRINGEPVDPARFLKAGASLAAS